MTLKADTATLPVQVAGFKNTEKEHIFAKGEILLCGSKTERC